MKNLSKILLGLALINLLAGCGAAKTSNSQNETQNVEKATENSINDTGNENTGEEKIVIYGNSNGDTTELVGIGGIAQEQGYFEEELAKIGYKMEIKGFTGMGPAVNEALATGEIDISDCGSVPAVVAKSNGVDTTLIGIGDAMLNYYLVAQPDTDIETPQDLVGKRVIVSKGTAGQFYFEKLMNAEGIDLSEMEVINATQDAKAIFLAKEADAYVVVDYIGRTFEAEGAAKVIASSAQGHPEWAAEGVLVARTSYIKEHPEVAVALLKGYIRAKKYVQEHPEESYATLSGGFLAEEDTEIGKKVFWLDEGQFDYLNGEPTQDRLDRMQELGDFFYEKGLITENINVNEFADTSYYEEAKKQLEEEE